MKAKLCFLLAAVLLAVVPGRAETTAQPARNESVLHITIVEPINYASGSTYSDFDRLDVALAAVAKQRNWPTLLKIERLAGNATTAYDSEVRIVLEGVKHQEGDEYLFRARILVMAGGKETDLGLVSYRHDARYIEGLDTLYEKIFRGAADVIADKVEPLLFPAASPGADNSPLHVTVDGTFSSEIAYTDYDRMARGIQEVVQERKWSRPIIVEKLIGGTPRYANELRINFQRTTGDQFIAHVILILDGKRQDLGDIMHTYEEHSYGRNEEARRQGVFKGGAAAIADRVEPLLFPKPVLHVTITDSISSLENAYTNFDRLDYALQKVTEQRHWPVKVESDRLAGNTPDYPTEVRITLQRINREPISDYVIRAWVILVLDGKKHDFGVVTARYTARLGLNFDDTYDNLFRVAAAAIADKVEPLLFPNLKQADPKPKK